jgi:hypothetical protein
MSDLRASPVDSNTLSFSSKNDPNTVDAWNFAFKVAKGVSTAGSQSVSQGGSDLRPSVTQNPSGYLNQTRCIGLCHGFDPTGAASRNAIRSAKIAGVAPDCVT